MLETVETLERTCWRRWRHLSICVGDGGDTGACVLETVETLERTCWRRWRHLSVRVGDGGDTGAYVFRRFAAH